eukprot:scaffold1896_cov121-Isochrysis_galbana.AAC.2
MMLRSRPPTGLCSGSRSLVNSDGPAPHLNFIELLIAQLLLSPEECAILEQLTVGLRQSGRRWCRYISSLRFSRAVGRPASRIPELLPSGGRNRWSYFRRPGQKSIHAPARIPLLVRRRRALNSKRKTPSAGHAGRNDAGPWSARVDEESIDGPRVPSLPERRGGHCQWCQGGGVVFWCR